jgi:hypothetical protein
MHDVTLRNSFGAAAARERCEAAPDPFAVIDEVFWQAMDEARANARAAPR